MRHEVDIALCRCPRCIAARRMQLLCVASVCITFACVGYLVFDFSRPKSAKIPHLALRLKTLLHLQNPPPPIQVQPSQSPLSQQLTEAPAGASRPQPAVPSVTATEPSPPIVQPTVAFPSITEKPVISRVEQTAVWVPFVIGISPGQHGEFAAAPSSQPETSSTPMPALLAQSKEDERTSPELRNSVTAAEPTPTPETVANLASGSTESDTANGVPHDASTSSSTLESPPIGPVEPSVLRAPEIPVSSPPPASAESSTRDSGNPERKENAREATGPPIPNEVPAKPALAVADPTPSPKVQQPTPVANISLTQSRENARKTRERELARSSANLYASVPTPSPRSPPAEQRTESEASAPPPPVEVPSPSKSVNRERKGDTDVAGDLRRFAVNYLRSDEKENVADQERFYAGSVHFHGEGDLSWTRIAAATRRYHQNAHQRRYTISQAASVRGPVDGGFWIVEQPYAWTRSDGTRTQTGRSVLRMRVIPSGHGDFKITSVEEVGR
jgi:hypothetical protein